MNSKTKKTMFVVVGIILIGVALLAYSKFFAVDTSIAPESYSDLQTYQYTSEKGQKYSLKFFSGAKLLRAAETAKALGNDDLKTGSYIFTQPTNAPGLLLSISEPIGKPLSKTCTGTERFAFSVGEYEVCKMDSGDKGVAAAIAKVGNDGKYFAVILGPAYSKQRASENGDADYLQKVRDFDLLRHQKKLTEILESIRTAP